MQLNEIIRDYRDIKQDYAYDADIMSNENERTARLKWIIDNRLSSADKVIILLYADSGSYRKVAQRLKVSHMTVQKYIKRIREEILLEYERLTDNDNHRDAMPVRGDNILSIAER